MKLVVGLGNPGVRYRWTRHNLGFVVVERLAERWAIPLAGRRHEAEIGSGEIAGVRTVLARPQTFMNASGEAVAKLRRAHRLTPSAVIAVYDDLDLALGRVRVRAGGGAGGHRGVVSLIDALGADFARVRIGVGRPPGGADPVDFLTVDRIPESERSILVAAVERAADAVESLLQHGLAPTMNAFNRAAPVS